MDMNPPAPIEVQIDELVLYGFAQSDRHRIAAAVQAELTRLLSDPAARASFTGPRAVARLDGGAFHLAANAKPGAIGAQVAQSLQHGLKQVNTPSQLPAPAQTPKAPSSAR